MERIPYGKYTKEFRVEVVKLVGYAMRDRITKKLVSQSLFRAVTSKRPGKGLIHHSTGEASIVPMTIGSCLSSSA